VLPPLRLRVQREDATPIAGAIVALHSLQDDAWSRFLPVDADGRVSFVTVPDAELVASVFLSRADMEQGLPPCHGRSGLRGGPEERVLSVPRESFARGSMFGIVVADDGQAVAQAHIELRALHERSFHATCVTSATGEFRTDRLTAQSYEVVVLCAGPGTFPLGPLEIQAGDAFDLGEIRLPRPVPWSAAWPSPAAPDGDAYELVKVDRFSDMNKRWIVAAGAGPPPPAFTLFPGQYEWLVYREGRRLARESIDLR
jgi:hypothetical protein